MTWQVGLQVTMGVREGQSTDVGSGNFLDFELITDVDFTDCCREMMGWDEGECPSEG